MVEQKFDEIVMLVHPLWSEFKSGGFDLELLAKGSKDLKLLNEIELNRFRLQKRLFDARVKIKFGVYGETLLRYKNKPSTVIVLFDLDSLVFLNKDVKNIYFKSLKRFTNFCTREFKDRFVISKLNDLNKSAKHKNIFSDNEKLNKKYMEKLSKNIKLVSFGEVTTGSIGCIPQWTRMVANKLTDAKYKIVSKNTIAESSLGEYLNLHEFDVNFKPENLVLKKRLLAAKLGLNDKADVYEVLPGVSRNSMNKRFNFKKGHKSLVK